ncbi:MAG: hypothetical protein K0U60_02565 [Actinomycetia bacterium]|nr:hypothetical protein [Actinomycetes bacterium]MCH9801120.1 hypothetical protein [Actinomycetes bacterium]
MNPLTPSKTTTTSSRERSVGELRIIWALMAIVSLLAASLVMFVGTPASQADDEDIAPNLSFVGAFADDQTGLNAPYGMAFDRYGNLWVANNRQDYESITMYSYGEQQQFGSVNQPPTATIKINKNAVKFPYTRVQGPLGLSFDAAGNLWVGTENAGLLRLAESQLPLSGGDTAKVLTPDCQVTGNKTGLLFGQNGDPKQIQVHPDSSQTVILVANPGPNQGSRNENKILAFNVTGCNGVINKKPDWVLDPASTSNVPSRPWGVAIVPDSTLTDTTFWISGSNGTLQSYRGNALTGNLSQATTLSGTAGTGLNTPEGITIGPGSDQLQQPYSIWVANTKPNAVNVYWPDNPQPILRIVGPNTLIDDPGSVAFDPNGGLWVSNSDFQIPDPGVQEIQNSVRRYGLSVIIPIIPFNPPPPFVPPVNPTAGPTASPAPVPSPTITPNPTPKPRKPYLIVDARKASKDIKFMKRTQIVNWEGTDGELTKIKAKCFLKGKRLTGKAERINCDITKKKGKGRESTAGSKAIRIKPSCTVGLTFTAKVVAKFPDFLGAQPEKWSRSWKVKNQPKKRCRIPGTG